MKKAIALLLPLALLASTVSCAEKKPNSSSDTATESEIEIASDSTVKDHGPKYQRYASMTPEEIVGELTLEQKANQMVQPAVYNITTEDMKANDYGSHAQQNINRIITHIQSVAEKTNTPISYEVINGIKNSFNLYKEAVERQTETGHQLLILTASREYGLDDWLFGPPERHAIQRSQVPVMLINPRSDLFSLCD